MILDDLAWLGITWDEPVLRQSDRMASYGAALDALWARGLLYPCHCSRRDIATAMSAPQEGAMPPPGPDGPIYPGTCRPTGTHASNGPRPTDCHLRLDSARALNSVDLTYHETGIASGPDTAMEPEAFIERIGDVVVARRDFGTSYHLSVVLDDAAQGITHVVRGADLSAATPIHVLLQRLLGVPTPIYHHHRLIRDTSGKRLAKRDDARAIRTYRDDGASPSDIRALVGL